jgi:hypothetical protein
MGEARARKTDKIPLFSPNFILIIRFKLKLNYGIKKDGFYLEEREKTRAN